jgi:hypothetical protein
MASDSTFKEPESASEEPEDEASPRPTPNPMRPPRPAKRKASGRIPLPVPFNRTSLEVDTDAADGELDADSAASDSYSAPSVSYEDDRDEPAIPLMASRSKPPSLRPEESFADLDAELFDRAPPAPISDRVPPAPVEKRARATPIERASSSSDRAAPFSERAAPGSFSDQAPPAPFSDRAPAAPVTPRRAAAARDATDATPPRPIPFASLRAERDDEPEPTIVGKVPDNLLELSGGGDETRAFTAPRELIELAKRKREERRESRAPKEMHASVTERPPAPEEPEGQAAPAVLVESGPPRAMEEDAAPPVARTLSGEMEAVALPSRRRPDSEPPDSEPPELEPPEASGPVIEIDPASELSGRAGPGASAQGRGPASAPLSSSKAAPTSKRFWIWVAILVLVGITIARWRDIAQLLHR